jgi:hypothetical protein
MRCGVRSSKAMSSRAKTPSATCARALTAHRSLTSSSPPGGRATPPFAGFPHVPREWSEDRSCASRRSDARGRCARDCAAGSTRARASSSRCLSAQNSRIENGGAHAPPARVCRRRRPRPLAASAARAEPGDALSGRVESHRHARARTSMSKGERWTSHTRPPTRACHACAG